MYSHLRSSYSHECYSVISSAGVAGLPAIVVSSKIVSCTPLDLTSMICLQIAFRIQHLSSISDLLALLPVSMVQDLDEIENCGIGNWRVFHLHSDINISLTRIPTFRSSTSCGCEEMYRPPSLQFGCCVTLSKRIGQRLSESLPISTFYSDTQRHLDYIYLIQTRTS